MAKAEHRTPPPTDPQQQPGQPPVPPTDPISAAVTAQHTEVAVRKEKQKKVSDLLELYKGSIANALPSMLTPERMIRVALSAMSKTPLLLDCTQHSLMGSILTCAQLGLMPDGVTGEAYLIPFKNNKKKIVECTVIIGYKGLCTLAYRSGLVLSIQARAVYSDDVFEYELGLNEKLKHTTKGCTDPTKITHFYSIVRMLNGGHTFDVMTIEAVNKVRDESANYKFAYRKEDTIWHKNYGEMGCKTVLRRNLKYVPFSAEVSRAISQDELAEAGKQNIKLEILDDLATPEDMKNAAYAEELEGEENERKDQAQNETDQRGDQAQSALKDLQEKLKQQTGTA